MTTPRLKPVFWVTAESRIDRPFGRASPPPFLEEAQGQDKGFLGPISPSPQPSRPASGGRCRFLPPKAGVLQIRSSRP